MTLTVENAKKMKFTLRYPPDKILNIYTGSFTANASSTTFTSERTHHAIDHTFGDNLLLQTTWSLDGGATWQDQDTSIPDLSSPSFPVFDTLLVNAYSTTTQIIVVAASFLTSAKTVTYKVVAMSKL